MLVLALEFSRGCAAHAWAGTLRRAPHRAQKRRAEPRPGLARGERSTRRRCKTNNEASTPAPHPTPDERGAHNGLDSRSGKRHLRSHADQQAGKDITRDRPEGPLPQNEIVRVRSYPQGPVSERRASTQTKRSGNSVACSTSRQRRPDHLPVMRERPNSQCSTG